ncbi:unnamed protein product, partial [marine sediment metagenome]
AYQGDKKFNVVAEKRTYLLSANIDDFAAFDEPGLWWNDGTAASPDWKKLDPYTQRSLRDQFPRWMNEDSDSPLRYVQEGDNLQIDPMPNTALSEGFWGFYIKKPKTMTSPSHYPFSGTTTEITIFTVLDDAIIDYVRWKLQHPLSKVEKGIIAEKDYDKSIAERIELFKRRLDISANNARMRGPTIGC